MATFAERGRQLTRFDAKTSRKQSPICGHVGNNRNIKAGRFFEDDHRIFAGAFQLKHDRSHLEASIDRPADAQDLVRIVPLDHLEKSAQALRVNIVSADCHRRLSPNEPNVRTMIRRSSRQGNHRMWRTSNGQDHSRLRSVFSIALHHQQLPRWWRAAYRRERSP